jgi:hypothetical protein
MHKALWVFLPSVPLGQVERPSAWRQTVTGVVTANALVNGNIEKV